MNRRKSSVASRRRSRFYSLRRSDSSSSDEESGSDDAAMNRSLENFRSSLRRLANARSREIASIPATRPRSAQPISRPISAPPPNRSSPTLRKPSLKHSSFGPFGPGFEAPPPRHGEEESLLRSRAFWKKLEYKDLSTGETETVRLPGRYGRPPLKRPASAAPPETAELGADRGPSLTEEQKAQLEEDMKREERLERQRQRREEESCTDIGALFARLQQQVRQGQSSAEKNARRKRPPPVKALAPLDPAVVQTGNMSNLQVMFARLKTLLATLWRELHVSAEKQREFAKLYHYPETMQNYGVMFKEVERLCLQRSLFESLLHMVQRREAAKSRLLTLAKSTELLCPHTTATQENLVAEVVGVVWTLRAATCSVMDAVYRCREASGGEWASPLLYEGQNYVMAMQSDINSLEGTPLGRVLAPRYSALANPLLLSEEATEMTLRTRAQVAAMNSRAMSRAIPAADRIVLEPSPIAARRPEHPEKKQAEGPVQTERQKFFARLLQLKNEEEKARVRQEQLQLQDSSNTMSSSAPRRNVYVYPASLYRQDTRPEGDGQQGGRCRPTLHKLLDPAPQGAPIRGRRPGSAGVRLRPPSARRMPPSAADHAALALDALGVEEAAQDEFSSRPSLSRLLICESLIYAEPMYLHKAASKRRWVKVTGRINAALRLFIVTLRRKRARRYLRGETASEDGGFGLFMDWVSQHAPDWLAEVRSIGDENGAGGLISGSDSSDGTADSTSL
eukprot:Hpha_TRINITY_DN31119_c0_g1::TRINITY_DN31119_c0_g1_i1::g.33076::m.33076